ncbi:MAG: helix-turn-helix domain-containing protein [Lachnospiraceae bacterium]|nr:helix-turn-helix domain-containing protein [Lachnospiraceae bacterium]
MMIAGLDERLRKMRKCIKISQKAVADIVGVKPSVISNYEKGERTPSVDVLLKLASLYHCSVDYLLGIEKSSNALIDVSMLNEEQRLLLQQFLASIKQ